MTKELDEMGQNLLTLAWGELYEHHMGSTWQAVRLNLVNTFEKVSKESQYQKNVGEILRTRWPVSNRFLDALQVVEHDAAVHMRFANCPRAGLLTIEMFATIDITTENPDGVKNKILRFRQCSFEAELVSSQRTIRPRSVHDVRFIPSISAVVTLNQTAEADSTSDGTSFHLVSDQPGWYSYSTLDNADVPSREGDTSSQTAGSIITR
jgi:hypothetical protein